MSIDEYTTDTQSEYADVPSERTETLISRKELQLSCDDIGRYHSRLQDVLAMMRSRSAEAIWIPTDKLIGMYPSERGAREFVAAAERAAAKAIDGASHLVRQDD